MCGFVGLISKKNKYKDYYRSVVQNKLDLISHRGPDGSKICESNDCILGHSILSLQGTNKIQNQPYTDGRYFLLFNGEILNISDIKYQLNEYNDIFEIDDSDTSALFYGLIKFGFDFLKTIDGFYTCMFYDEYKKTGFIARDPGGQKQLYYSTLQDSLQISSEIKGLKIPSSINLNAIELFKAVGYIPAPETILENVRALKTGEIIHFSFQNDELKIDSKKRLFKIKNDNNLKNNSPSEIRKIVQEKVKKNLLGNSEISILLSGGIDSSIILYEANKFTEVKAYTAEYDLPDRKKKKYSVDISFAKQLCEHLKVNHTIVKINNSKEYLLDKIDKSQYFLDQPHFIASIIANFEIADYISKNDNNSKIVLNGNGGDELFLGYERYKLQSRINKIYLAYKLFDNKISRSILNKLLKDFKPNYLKYNINPHKKYSAHISSWLEQDFIDSNNNKIFEIVEKRKKILEEVFYESNLDLMNDYCQSYGIQDLLTWIPDDSNVISDRAFASVGIEARSPLLISQLYEDIVNKLNFSEVPKIPKEALLNAYKEFFPENFFNRKKWGWISPVEYWLYCLGDEVLNQALESEIIRKYFAELIHIKRPLNWKERWKIIIFWRWHLVNKDLYLN